MSQESLQMYSTTWCSDCRRAKAYLREYGVPFTEINIEESPKAAELVMQHNDGRRRVPTFEIDGNFYGNPPLIELGSLLGLDRKES